MSTATSEINFTEKCLERHNSVESVNSSNDEYEQESEDNDENFELDDDLVNLLKQKYNVMSSMPPPQFTNTRYYCALELVKNGCCCFFFVKSILQKCHLGFDSNKKISGNGFYAIFHIVWQSMIFQIIFFP